MNSDLQQFFPAKNTTEYYWLVTSKSEHDLVKAKLTFTAGLLSFIMCIVTVIVYFSMHKNSSVFNSMNHFFGFAFALGVISSVNYCASALIRLYSEDVDLLIGFCDISAVHVLLSTYPMLLCELGYFWAAYRRLSNAYDLGKREQLLKQKKNKNKNNSSINEDEKDVVQSAIDMVDSGDAFFRNFIGVSLFVCIVTAMAFKAALPTQHEYGTKFSPSDQSWCWLPTEDGDADDDDGKKQREVLYVFLQLFVEVVPLIGTPLVGIASLILLYRSLGYTLPRSAKMRVFYIVIFIITFGDSIFVRLQFSSAPASYFQAFAEPFIACMNAITFLVSEIYPTWVASRPRTLNSEDQLYYYNSVEDANDNVDQNNTDVNEWEQRPNREQDNDEESSLLVESNNNNNNTNNKSTTVQHDDENYQPPLAVAIEAGAFLRAALNRVSESKFQTEKENENENENDDNVDQQQQRASSAAANQRRISQKLNQYITRQRNTSTMIIITLFSFLNGFCDVWSFVSFGTFSTSSVGANVGVVALAVAYSKWMPNFVSMKIEVTHHIILALLSIALPILVAALVTRLFVQEGKIVERRHSMIILGACVVVLTLTWTGSLSFFSIHWFDATNAQRQPVARYIAITGMSCFSGLQLAYHRIFLTLFKLPSEPYITSTLLDVVASSWLTNSAQVILTAASAERFPTQTRKTVQSASTLAYLIGATVSLIAGVFETSGAFGAGPIVCAFLLLLTLDWSALADQVLIPSKNSLLSMRRGGRNDDDQEEQNNSRRFGNYSSSLMFAREIEGLNVDEDDNNVVGDDEDQNQNQQRNADNESTRSPWKPASISTGMTPRTK